MARSSITRPARSSFEIDGREYMLLRPLGPETVDPARAGALVDAALTDPVNRFALASWFGVDEHELDDPVVRARVVDALVGQRLAVELDEAWEGDDTEVDPKLDPIGPTDPVKPPRERPTWIAIVVVDESGRGFPGTIWRITLPDGEQRMLRLDADSRWRADDVREAGSVHLHATTSLAGLLPPQPASLEERAGDVFLGPQAEIVTMLATGREHRLVVVDGRTEIVLLDDAQTPVPSTRCEARFDLSVTRGKTDAQGTFVVWHPSRARELEVRFPDLDGGTWQLLRTEPLERAQEA